MDINYKDFLKEELIDEVVNSLNRCKVVPLPGGHGVFFPTLRRLNMASPEPTASFDVRAFLVLVLLGGSVEHDTSASKRAETWTRANWWMNVSLWFEEHCRPVVMKPGPPTLQEPPPWMYFLAALAEISGDLVARSDLGKYEQGSLLVNIEDLFNLACKRIWDLNKVHDPTPPQLEKVDAKETGHDPVRSKIDNDIVGRPLSQERMPAEWTAVRKRLSKGGTEADILLMKYFLHTFHASLGVPQPAIDSRHGAPRHFYSQIPRLLKSDPEFQRPHLREVAHRISEVLSQTAVLTAAVSDTTFEDTAPDGYRVPLCFKEANIRTRPPLRSMVEAHLESEKSIGKKMQDQLLAAHDCALILANAAIDYVLAAEEHPLRFDQKQYEYAFGRVKNGEKEYKARYERSRATAIQHDDAVSGPVDRPMTRPFAEQLAKGGLIADCTEVLQKIQTPLLITTLFGEDRYKK